MAAPAYSHAGRSDRARATAEQPAVREVELPWWAIALPAVVFAALLLLLVGPSDAQAAEGSTGHVTRFVALLRDSIVQLLS
ncbi:hypothetical protein AB0F42_32175 [Streptomyces buecherae]|uniref:hypothetical protein n=1 Tax=Streptomyces buecherae TaxID=2763006 RepID=UPI0033BFC899